jgi:tetratricopeptide (TPR) repeat protein
MGAFTGRLRWLLAALVAAAGPAGSTASADDSADIDGRVAAYETEARQLATDLPRPNQISGAAGQRRLLDAQVAYALGDYDRAALMLFELAAKPGPEHETANFYLGEALFHKGDRGAAHRYYDVVVANGTVSSKYYQPALERLIEIAIAQNDHQKSNPELVQRIDALDRISPALRRPSLPYVRGKLSYAQGNFEEAIAFFQDVPKGSESEMPAAYYLATTYVATKDIQRASDIFTDLIGKKPRSANDRRIIELSQLALGRLYYERDQASKAIESYLLVDRRSDLFPDALYEVSWVYVKSKQYDKALRTLELLSASDPLSTKTPTVRLLEGNLRIRKAQLIRGAQIQGTLDPKSGDDPATEYDRAAQMFKDTHDTYAPSYASLAQLAESSDPGQYLAQIAGREPHVFQTAAPIPEAAVQYLRDEPEVQRVVAVEADLGTIHADLAQTEATIARLEGVAAASDRAAAYPALAGRRARVEAIADEVIKIRSALAEQQLRLVGGALPPASTTRRQRVATYAAMPNAAKLTSDRLTEAARRYDAIERAARDVDGTIGATHAIAVALRKHGRDADERDVPAAQTNAMTSALDDAAREAQAIEDALAAVNRQIQIGRDLAAIGDEVAPAARAARAAVKEAEDAEHKVIAGLASTSRDRSASQRLVALGDRTARLAEQLAVTGRQIDATVDAGLQDIRGLLGQARAELAELTRELREREAESRQLGGATLGATFAAIKAKLYDIVVRADVGNVDVGWSQKEDADDDLKRLNLSRQRELKQLRDEFRDILDGGTSKPSSPARKPVVPPPAPAPGGRPDMGAPDPRIAPGASEPTAPAAPIVRPGAAPPASKADASKADASKADAKMPGAAKGGAR